MAAIYNNTVPHFRVSYLKATLEMTLYDLVQGGYSSYGTLSNFLGLFQAKDPDGNIIYANAGFSLTAPNFSSPDTEGNVGTWLVPAFSAPLNSAGDIKAGRYTFTYLTTFNNGTTVYTTTKYYDYKYVSPTVDILQEASCDNSILTSDDNTEYTLLIDGKSYSPVTTTRSHTVTPPSDSSFSPAPGTTADKTRYIGGGSTDATRLWTNDWQTDISTILQYNLATWDAYVWIIVTDTVTGHKGIDVICEDCDCTLLQCYLNLIDRYDEAEKGHRRGAYELRETALKATMYMEAYSKELSCGADTTATCNALNALLANYDCACGQQGSSSSHAVLQRGTGTGGGGSHAPSSNPFVFWWEPTNPSGGNSGDVWFNTITQYLYKNVGGTWSVGVCLKGDKGDTGASGLNGSSSSIIWNDFSSSATGSGTNMQPLKTFTLASGTMGNDEDVLEIKSLFLLAQNPNGKTVQQTFGGDLLVDYYCDDLVDSDTNLVLLESSITRTSAANQSIVSKSMRGKSGYQSLLMSHATKNLLSSLVITADGQDDVSSAADITCEQLEIRYMGKVGGVIGLGDNFKAGNPSVVAMVQYDVVFLSPYDISVGNDYVVNCVVVDTDGNSQVLYSVPGSQTVSGFSVVSPVTGKLNWMTSLPQS